MSACVAMLCDWLRKTPIVCKHVNPTNHCSRNKTNNIMKTNHRHTPRNSMAEGARRLLEAGVVAVARGHCDQWLASISLRSQSRRTRALHRNCSITALWDESPKMVIRAKMATHDPQLQLAPSLPYDRRLGGPIGAQLVMSSSQSHARTDKLCGDVQ